MVNKRSACGASVVIAPASGAVKNQKKITSHARRSFKWLRGNRLKKEYKYLPKVEN